MGLRFEPLVSWLKFLDVEYLDDATCEALANLNINEIADQVKIIDLAMRDEFNSLNETSRVSMIAILDEVSKYPDSAVRAVIERVGMPFNEPLLDYRTFFEVVKEQLFSK
jgi:hypothetical protein